MPSASKFGSFVHVPTVKRKYMARESYQQKMSNETTPEMDLQCLDYCEAFTELHRENTDTPKCVREAAFLRLMLRQALQPVKDGDLLAGRLVFPPVGLSPEPGGFGIFFHSDPLNQIKDRLAGEPGIAERVEKLVQYWKGKTTTEKMRGSFDEYTLKYLPSDRLNVDAGISSFPLYRIASCNLDYNRFACKRGCNPVQASLDG